jgi:hypothetical protein
MREEREKKKKKKKRGSELFSKLGRDRRQVTGKTPKWRSGDRLMGLVGR